MKLWCYAVDKGRWGEQLAREAVEHGIDANLFVEPVDEMQPGDYAFMRIPQWEPELSIGKLHATELQNRGLILIPDFFTILSYEDKIMQTQAHSCWMPETEIIYVGEAWRMAERVADELGYPFLSKSRRGSSSVNVRMIKTPSEAALGWGLEMQGAGISMKTGKGRTDGQKGYLIWQKFVPGNSGDIRVCINGKYMLMLWRDNAHGSPFASGSGKNYPINEPDDWQEKALDKAREFFNAFDLKWNGIDLVYDREQDDWLVLETTLGWSAKAYENCRYFQTDYFGKDVWTLFCKQLLDGVFG